MEQLTESILVMFAIMVLSYLTKRWRLMPENTNPVLTALLYNVTAPCLIFSSLAFGPGKAVLKDSLAVIGVAFVYGLTVSTVSLWLLRKTPASDITAGVVAFSSVFANTGFMGIPLVYLLFGASGVVMGALYDQVHNLFMYTAGAMMLGGRGQGWWPALRSRYKEPPVLALLAGLLVMLTGFQLPRPLVEPIKMIGDSTTVLAMFAIGQFMDLSCFRKISRLKKLLAVIGIRLVLIPAVVLGLTGLFHFPAEVRGVLGIMLAGPSAVMSAVLAQRYRQDYEFAVMAVVATTGLSVITLPIVMSLL